MILGGGAFSYERGTPVLLVGIGIFQGAHAVHDREVELADLAIDSRTLESALPKLAAMEVDFVRCRLQAGQLVASGPCSEYVQQARCLEQATKRKHGLSTEQFPVSAYVGSSKNLKDLKDRGAILRIRSSVHA